VEGLRGIWARGKKREGNSPEKNIKRISAKVKMEYPARKPQPEKLQRGGEQTLGEHRRGRRT